MRLELSRTIAGGHAGAVRLTTPSLGTVPNAARGVLPCGPDGALL